MSYTKADIEGMFRRLVRALGSQMEGGSCKGLGLEYNPIYGGYAIVEYGENGSERHPFGLFRRNRKEMYLSMEMAAIALENLRDRQAKEDYAHR